jgi:tRNA dimethylallyltransferase
MQVYKEIPIITASPPKSYKSEIGYYLYNFLSIDQEFSVIKYLQLATEKIKEISNRNKLILLIGGSGLYINSLLFGYNKIPDISPDIRRYVRELYSKVGALGLWQQLKQLDKLAVDKIKASDSQRLIRALEVFLQTGKSIFFYQTLSKALVLSRFNFKIIFLYPERNFLYKTCNTRLQQLFCGGAIDEVAGIKKQFGKRIEDYSAGKAVGISEILAYLEGNMTLNEALTLAQARTRQYAKRQITWFKNQIEGKITFEYSTEKEFAELMTKLCKDKL